MPHAHNETIKTRIHFNMKLDFVEIEPKMA